MPPSTNYRTPEELAADTDFIRWVQNPTPASDEQWQDWLTADTIRPTLVRQARSLVLLMQFPTVSLELTDRHRLEAQFREKLKEGIRADENQPETPIIPLGTSRTNRRSWLVASAASVALLLLAGFWFWQQDTATPNWDYSTAYGQTRRIELPDHSVVTLNANSRLRLADSWNEQATREVWIEGEAFFEIRKKPVIGSATFTVHSGQIAVSVLGTTFNVTQRRNTTQVVLSTGKIRLEGLPTGNQLMTPGDRVVVRLERPARQQVERSRVNPANYAAWQQGEWILENTSLNDISTMLNDQFGLTVTLANPELGERRLSGRMSIESPDVFLDNLSTILGVSARRISANQVRIQPR